VAIKYNAALGFKPTDIITGKHFRQYVLTKDDYFATTPRLHALTKAMHDEAHEVEISNVFFEKLKTEQALNLECAMRVVSFAD
jgi:hypothetical protein